MVALDIKKDTKGIADVFVIAFMLLMVVLAGSMLHGQALLPLASSMDRQRQQQAEHLYKTLELAHVENYSVSYLSAIADNLVLIHPLVPGEYLREQLDGALAYLRPSGYGVWINLVHGRNTWDQIYPTDASPPELTTKQFSFKGKISVIRAEVAENRVVMVDANVTIFKL